MCTIDAGSWDLRNSFGTKSWVVFFLLGFAGIWMMDADQEVHHRRYLLARFPIANVTFIAARSNYCFFGCILL